MHSAGVLIEVSHKIVEVIASNDDPIARLVGDTGPPVKGFALFCCLCHFDLCLTHNHRREARLKRAGPQGPAFHGIVEDFRSY